MSTLRRSGWRSLGIDPGLLLFVVAVVTPSLTLAGAPLSAEGQLISPGRLGSAHAPIEGIRSCTSCHRLRQSGVDRDLCLACHVPLSESLAKAKGFHAGLDEPDCAVCHKDHLGREFDMRRLDETTFEHSLAGYELRGTHLRTECESCHTSEYVTDPVVVAFKSEHGALDRTFLGLSDSCSGCHRSNDPHADQFTGRECSDCHDEVRWEEASRLDHSVTAYPLAGAHTNVECASCHTPESGTVRYTPTEFGDCRACHEDPHGAFEPSCASCHAVEGWGVLARGQVERSFDHNQTEFRLEGAHEQANCEACHASRPLRTDAIRITYVAGTEGFTYPYPTAEACRSCHVDEHEGDLSERYIAAGCEQCHGSAAWEPTSFDRERHRSDTDFPLEGAHAATPCVSCHQTTGSPTGQFVPRVADSDCASCHQDHPHDERFGRYSCDVCHSTADFTSIEFDHDEPTLSFLGESCAACHVSDDPHDGQFGERRCSECHDTDGFAIADFDHDATAFSLDGAHVNTACAACHMTRGGPGDATVRIFRPLDKACSACHAGAER